MALKVFRRYLVELLRTKGWKSEMYMAAVTNQRSTDGKAVQYMLVDSFFAAQALLLTPLHVLGTPTNVGAAVITVKLFAQTVIAPAALCV